MPVNSNVLIISVSKQSSTYLYSGASHFRSFAIMRKNKGLNLVHCGTPGVIRLQYDLWAPTLTRCGLPWRKFEHQFNHTGGTLSIDSLCMRMSWSIRSKALEKSIKQVLIAVLGDFKADVHYWTEHVWYKILLRSQTRTDRCVALR